MEEWYLALLHPSDIHVTQRQPLIRLARVVSRVTRMGLCVQKHLSTKTLVNLPKPSLGNAMLLKLLLGVSCTLTHSPQTLTSAQGNEGHSPHFGAQISAPAAVWRRGSTCLPVIPAAFPTSILLTQLQIRVVLPKKSNLEQVTRIDQGSMIIVFHSLIAYFATCISAK